MSHMYELARQLQAPGVVTTAYFNPTRLTPTLRNMTRKSIATGNHNGGWSSKTKDVRELIFSLAGERPVVYVQQASNYMAFYISRPITDDNLSEMIGLLEADCTLQKMDYDDNKHNRYHPTRSDFYKTIDERHDQNIAKLKFAGQGRAHNMIVRNSKIRQQIATTFLKERTIEEIAIAERIARLVDENKEFLIPTTHAF